MRKQLIYLVIATVVIASSLSFTLRKSSNTNNEKSRQVSEAPIGGTAVVE